MDTNCRGVIPVTGDLLNGNRREVIPRLYDLSLRGRLVGWGIWRPMNELFRGEGGSFFSDVSGGRYGFLDGGKIGVKVDRGTKWTFLLTGGDGVQRFILWDMWEWAKREPREGEGPRRLYLAHSRVSDRLGVRCRHWFSPSALASPLMRLNGVRDHYPEEPELGIPHLARWANMSGRMQVFRIGTSDQPAREYDLNAAYGWGLSMVPSLRGARFRRSYGGGRWALYRVRWSIPKGREDAVPLYPFGVRTREGSIEYPPEGEGWYWSPLVEEASLYFGGCIEVLECLSLDVADETLPFEYLNGVYDERQPYEPGSLEDGIIKWAISATWGKLCQKPNPMWRSSSQCLLWAGMATSIVNAELLRVACLNRSRLWHIHVDQVLLSGERNHIDRVGRGPGKWKSTPYDAIDQYRVGVWRGRQGEAWKEKTQGIPAGRFPWDEAEEEWGAFGPLGRVPSEWREFRGFGCGEFDKWLTEEEVSMEVPLRPGPLDSVRNGGMKRPGRGSIIQNPPDRVENPLPFDARPEEYVDELGFEHNPARSQERRLS